MAVISAERIMYRHAIELCQAAALDELFGNPQLCSQRYQTAYMMLHTLAEQVNCDQDKTVLTRYGFLTVWQKSLELRAKNIQKLLNIQWESSQKFIKIAQISIEAPL